MRTFEVKNPETINDFHELPLTLYKDNPDWVPHLRILLENSFHPAKNKALHEGGLKRWLLKDGRKTIGRIAAFHTRNYSTSYNQPTGCIGFFECIQDPAAAKILFDTARDWLQSEGMEAMDGPVNPGENFFNWGVLTEGFKQQTFGMTYNLPYYKELFSAYGFKTYYEQYSYRMDITSPDLPERFWKIAAWVAKKPGFHYEHFSFRNQDRFIRDFISIYQQAWQKHDNYKPIEPEEIRTLISESRIFLEEEFIWFVYHEGKPVAFFMMIPDLNQIIRKMNSDRINFWNILKIIYYKKTRVISRCRVVVMGVIPQYQRMGLESGIFYQLRQVMLRKPWYKEMELSWVGDFNPKMISLFKAVGANHEITHHTMRYMFDPDRTFIRAAIIKD